MTPNLACQAPLFTKIRTDLKLAEASVSPLFDVVWGRVSSHHQYTNPNSSELGVFLRPFMRVPTCFCIFLRKPVDFASATRGQLLYPFISVPALFLSTPFAQKKAEVHKAHCQGPMNSTMYKWTNLTVLFQVWRGIKNHNQNEAASNMLVACRWRSA